jgi:hypothetical protein
MPFTRNIGKARPAYGTVAILLKINAESNPVVQQIKSNYGRFWTRARLFRQLSYIARPGYERVLSMEASQLSPFPIKLNHIFQTASRRPKGGINVSLDMGSDTLSELHHRLELNIDEAYQTSWKPPGFQELLRSMYWIGNNKAPDYMNIVSQVTQTEADKIMTDLRELSKNGAGEIMAEGFLIHEHLNLKFCEPGQPSISNKREFLFTGHLEK